MSSLKLNKSPLRYPGGKTRACDVLNKILEENFAIKDFDTVVSPFFGGGSFEFYLQNKYSLSIVANDKFQPLCNFWNTCKHNKQELCDKLDKNVGEISKKDFLEYRQQIVNEKNKIQQAYMYFVINRCSFNGATLSGGFSLEASKKRFTKSSVDRVNQLDLNNVSISDNDFEEFIESVFKKNTLLFLDPPYYLEKKSKLYGNNGDMHENFDHQKLFNCVSGKKNWMMTYNNCDYIKKLYKDFKIIETSWSYGMNKSKQSSEIVIIS